MKTLQDLVNSMGSMGANVNSSANIYMDNGLEKTHSYRVLEQLVVNYGTGFLSLGLEHGDKVALFSDNNPEWIALSLGLNNVGLVDVPRGATTPAKDLNYIMDHSEVKAVIVENEQVLDKINDQVLTKTGGKFKDNNKLIIVSMTNIEGMPDILNLDELFLKGMRYKGNIPSLNENTLASIIYTSGTTGNPKGIELTHGNFISNIKACRGRLLVNKNDKFLSILPAWHVFERLVKYIALDAGAKTFYSSQKTLMKDFVTQNPTIVASVPRVWESFYDGVMKKVNKDSEWKKSMFAFALENKRECKQKSNNLEETKIKDELEVYLDKLVFSQIRKGLGNNFRYAISGGGKLPEHVDEFFDLAGISVLEGYGLTETAAALSIRVKASDLLYNVGPLLKGVEGKVVDAEILQECETVKEIDKHKEGILFVRGPNIMNRYYKNSEATAEVLDENGWFNTGDRVYFDAKDNIVIVGRQKDMIVRRNGENTNPNFLEEQLIKSKYISSAVVIGQDWKLLGTYLVPEFEALEKYCAEKDIPFVAESLSQILGQEEIQELYKTEIQKYVNNNSDVPEGDSIRSFALLEEPLTEGKELTATLKLRRNEINKIHSEQYKIMENKCN